MAKPWTTEDAEALRRRLAQRDGAPGWAASRVQFVWDGRRRTEYTQAWTADCMGDMTDGYIEALIADTMATVEAILRDRIAEDRAAFRAMRSSVADTARER